MTKQVNPYSLWGKIGRMKQDVTTLQNELETLRAENKYIRYRHELAREGRKFWRAEAKRLGTDYNYHAEALREEGRFVKVYTR